MGSQMTRYKQAEFEEEDSSSVGSVHLTEGSSATVTRVPCHTRSTLWKARSLLEKILICFSLILLLIVFILSILLGASGDNSEPRSEPVINGGNIVKKNSSSAAENKDEIGTSGPSYCVTQPCVTAAASIISAMDTSVKPCNDFYKYACGGWVRSNPAPDGSSTWGTFVKLGRQNQLVVRNVLERPFTELKSKAEQKAKLYYISCLDANETMEALGSTPMLRLLKDVGGWNVTPPADWNPTVAGVAAKVPMAGKSAGKTPAKKAAAVESKHWWNPDNWNLQKTIIALRNRYGMGGLFSWAVEEDDRNSSRHVIQIDQASFTVLTRENYLNKTANEKILKAYLDYMTKICVLLGGEENSTKRQMSAVIDFETELANITTPADERRDEEKMYHLMSIADLQEKAPFMSWKEYFTDAFRLVSRKITSKEMVVVHAPEYIEKMSNLVIKYNKTADGKTVLNNFLVWQTVKGLTAYLSRSFRDASRGLRKALVGSEGGEDAWRYCVTDTTNVLGFAVGAMFVRELFHGESKPGKNDSQNLSASYRMKAEDMINDVKTAFKKNLKNLTWMDKDTIQLAEEKVDAITDMIGFPNYILDPAQLDEKYKELEIRDYEYFDNNIRVIQYNFKKNLEKLDQVVNKTRWVMTPSAVNAYYTPTENQVVFPAGILQPPFYDIKHPRSLNFGGMGVVMGHELTHAFDDQGREYDQNGNLHQWWNNQTIQKFKTQTECVINQYAKYEINGQHINGKQTLGENIADNGGLKAAYHAYLDWANKNPEEEPLPGLNFTHRQLFFLGFAQVWCSSSTEEDTKFLIENNAHTPPKFRVIGPLSNLPDFSKEFKCPLGSPMNPHDKCEVW
ncbi:endothelin-converting enzyme homolog isoform X2 [Ischnura elegans]|uniref:endothelin-converting enzyme homolog isoform X2 n=2 Tax=Ischnura elegans TaxID=197161 RepID=UPI001ED8929D|nr:endothelin-converting enzyme homolog isoform X2 [Ischnura elegans]